MRASSSASSPSPRPSVVKPFARRPFSRNDAIRGSSSAIRIRLTSAPPRSGWSTGTTIVKRRARARARSSSSTRPPCASAIAFTIASPRPAPSDRPRSAARAEALEDRARCSLGGDARARVAHPEARLAVRDARAERDRPVARRCGATAFSASCIIAWVRRWRSATIEPAPAALERPARVARAPPPSRASSSVSCADVDRRRARGSRAARASRAGAGRRRSGSCGRARR